MSIFFKKSEQGVGEEIATPKGEYKVKKNKRVDIALLVFSVICAMMLWMYTVTTSDATKQFQNIPVTVKRVSIVTTQGYDIQYKDLKVNFTIQGSGATISQISEKSIEAYVDLSTINLTEITDTKIVQLPIVFNVPSNVRCYDKSNEYIEVKITKIVHNFQDVQD